MQFQKTEYKTISKSDYPIFILGGDVGGTNTNLGVFGVKESIPKLLASFHFKSMELRRLHFAVSRTLSYAEENYNIKITKACIAAAGVLSPEKDYVKTQNAPWSISKKELLEKTILKKIMLMNDFEAIGYGINMLSKNDVAVIKKAQRVPKAPIVVAGAGTGLGKATLIYDEHTEAYVPLPSEAGHADFAAQSQEELDLINFVRKQKKTKQSISYEQILSGQGLTNIYSFIRQSGKFKGTKHTKEIDKSKYSPEMISKYRKNDKNCEAAFNTFKMAYAGFLKRCAIDSLSFGGIYIAGGISSKNRGIFDKEFVKAFEDNYKMRFALKKMPIYLITNYNVGLLGAGFVGARMLR
ncbi:glucokinase [Candidatus Woesearchaeota archaeon]|nr:glucokinase [Candidatus Woesearchaeota archaeon]